MSGRRENCMLAMIIGLFPYHTMPERLSKQDYIHGGKHQCWIWYDMDIAHIDRMRSYKNAMYSRLRITRTVIARIIAYLVQLSQTLPSFPHSKSASNSKFRITRTFFSGPHLFELCRVYCISHINRMRPYRNTMYSKLRITRTFITRIIAYLVQLVQTIPSFPHPKSASNSKFRLTRTSFLVPSCSSFAESTEYSFFLPTIVLQS